MASQGRRLVTLIAMAAPDPRLLAAVRDVLRHYRGAKLALLFGSQSRGGGRPDSDADLAIRGEDLDRLALARDLSLATGIEFDVIDLDHAGYALLKSILRDGIVIHEETPGVAADWHSRAEARLEADRPGFERMRDALFTRLATGNG